MFNLIVTIISIALVAVLAIASIYYGGSAFNKGADEATVARIINEGSQIKGAAQLYSLDNGGSAPADIDVLLVDKKYLNGKPAGNWNVSAQYAISPVGSTATPAEAAAALSQCNAINAKLGHDLPAPPACDAVAWQDKQVCCETP